MRPVPEGSEPRDFRVLHRMLLLVADRYRVTDEVRQSRRALRLPVRALGL